MPSLLERAKQQGRMTVRVCRGAAPEVLMPRKIASLVFVVLLTAVPSLVRAGWSEAGPMPAPKVIPNG